MWYSEAISIWVTIIAGLLISLVLALQTIIITRSAEKGRWKQTVFTLQKAFIFLGIILIVVGIVAKVVGQKFSVWSSLCFPGIFYFLIMGLQYLAARNLYSSFQRKKEQAESKENTADSQSKLEDSNEKKDKYKGIYHNLSDEKK